jgi:hypothetical protein
VESAKKKLDVKSWLLTLGILLILGVIVVPLGLCGGGWSGPYRPEPTREAAVFSKARRDVFPDDVRASPAKYASTLVASPGLIKDFTRSPDGLVHFTVEHRYFDWIADHGHQRQIYFLSPCGEGQFEGAWPMSEPFKVGDMIVLYGTPSQVHEKVVGLAPVEFARTYGEQIFRDDMLEYGRPGSPIRFLR